MDHLNALVHSVLDQSVHRHQMGGCQNYGPFWGPYYTTARFILGTQKGAYNFDNYPNAQRLKISGLTGVRAGPHMK